MASQETTPTAPGPRPPSPAAPERRAKALSALSTSIDTINCVKDAIPNEIAKGVLSTLAGVLGTVKSTMRNKEDFEELARQCYEISLLLWRATTASSGGTLSGPVVRAVGDLKKSVDGIQDLVAERSQAGVASRALAVSMDKEKIAGWQRDLSRFLQIFNTELNVLTNAKLEEIIVMFERFRREGGTQTTPQGVLPPGKPSIFVGRADLVREVSTLLAQPRHVALVGTGGIGKSCLAKAVLNEPGIAEKFGAQRYFVRYDDMDASQVSYDVFLDRIGGTLGLTLGGSDRLSVVCAHLSAAPSLLVLDNAETFLDAAQDKTRIADAVDSLGALTSTVILLTTRSRALPSNVLWAVIAVPALKPAAAREAFTAVFHKHIEDTEVIDSLLQSLDYHPLSINLLAHAARENDWSLDELLDTWNKQQTDLLHNGDGKSQSLIVTLELSLNSPALRKLGDSVLHVLQIIAFLPQGVDRRELGGLFPSLTGASMIVDAVCKQSITYRRDNFVTMLAPVRLYISTTYNGALPRAVPLLTDVRTYYRGRLEIHGSVPSREEIVENGAWIIAEDVNTERTVILELTLLEDVVAACTSCTSFVLHLLFHKPRPTATIRPLVEAIPVPETITPKHRRYLKLRDSIRSLMSRKSTFEVTAPVVAERKGKCMYALSTLAIFISSIDERLELLLNAKELYSSAGAKSAEAMCWREIGRDQCDWGQLAAAEQSFRKAAHILRDAQDLTEEIYLNFARGSLMVEKGEVTQARQFFSEAVRGCDSDTRPEWVKKRQVTKNLILAEHGKLELWSGNYDRARQYLNTVMTQAARYPGITGGKFQGLLGLFELEMREMNFAQARRLVDEMFELAGKEQDEYDPGGLILESSYCKAGLLADEGKVDDSRLLLDTMLKKSNLWYLIMGRTELFAGNYVAAQTYLSRFVEICGSLQLVPKARGLRILGEIALCRRNHELANTLFSNLEHLLSTEIGISVEVMDFGETYWRLPAHFDGWAKFRNMST